jgi:hypothetical protein
MAAPQADGRHSPLLLTASGRAALLARFVADMASMTAAGTDT